MRRSAIVVLLALAGCADTGGPRALQTGGSVPRDARGEAILPAIPLAPVAPPAPAPAPNAAFSGAAVTIPTTPAPLLPAAKPVSCQHFKRCL